MNFIPLGLKQIFTSWSRKPRPPQLPDRPEIATCCKQTFNLFLEENRVQEQADGSGVPIHVWRCSVCLRRHRVMKVGEKLEPGKFRVN